MSLKKSFLHLLLGNVGVQVITLAFYPILSRIYSPADFGVFGFFTSTILILGIFSTGQLHTLLPNPQDDEEALSILKSCIVLNFSCSIFFFLVFFLFQKRLSTYYGDYTLIVALSVFFYGLNEAFKMWFIRFKAYKTNSLSINTNRLLSNALKVISPKAFGLVYSEVAANFATSVYGLAYTKKKFLHGLRIPRLTEVMTVIKDHISYPTVFAFGTFCQYLVFELPIFAIGRIFDKSILGNYVLANKLSVQAIWLVSASLVAILHNKFVDDINSGKGINFDFLIKFLFVLFVGSLPLSLGVYLLGDRALVFILGENWTLAGEILKILSPLIITKLLLGPILSLFLSSKKIRLLSFWRFCQSLALFVLFYISRDQNIHTFLSRYVIFDLCFDFGLVFIALYLFKKESIRRIE
jgi:O-antigen/teichoic acid export membrane protein